MLAALCVLCGTFEAEEEERGAAKPNASRGRVDSGAGRASAEPVLKPGAARSDERCKARGNELIEVSILLAFRDGFRRLGSAAFSSSCERSLFVPSRESCKTDEEAC